MTQSTRYRTQPHLLLCFGVLGLIASIIVCGLAVYHGDPLARAIVLALAITAFCGGVGAIVGFQRVVIDPLHGTLRFANLTTLHRWRSLRMADIDELEYDDFQHKYKALVSGLLIHMKRADGKRRCHRLLDHSLGSFSGASDLFRDIARAVRQARPRVDVDPTLID